MFSSLVDTCASSRRHTPIPFCEKLGREVARPWRQIALVLRRFAVRRRHGAATTVVPFIGDGVLDNYVARLELTPAKLEDIERRLKS